MHNLSHPFSGKDFVHGYSFNTVDSFIEPNGYNDNQPSPLIRLTDIELDQLEYRAMKQIKPVRTFLKSMVRQLIKAPTIT
ncbi:hypothetical protein EBR57_10030 [bacterium]|nr:hypothetical protein [bacterium]